MNVELLNQKSKTLSRMILSTRKDYFNNITNQRQKAFLETLVGAGLWYFPTGWELFSGNVSKKALNSLKNGDNPSLVKEHSYPRKIAGNQLYNIHLERIQPDGKYLAELYISLFGKFNLVLSDENQSLKRYQKLENFKSPEYAYEQAGIELVRITHSDLRKLQLYKRNK